MEYQLKWKQKNSAWLATYFQTMKEKKSSNACGLHTQKNVITWVGLMTNHKKIYLYPDSVVCLYTMCITRAIVVATDRPIYTRLNRTGNQNKTNTAILILWIHLLSQLLKARSRRLSNSWVDFGNNEVDFVLVLGFSLKLGGEKSKRKPFSLLSHYCDTIIWVLC